MIMGERKEIGDTPGFRFRTERDCSKYQATDNADSTEPGEPVCGNPFSHALHCSMERSRKGNRYGRSGISDLARTSVLRGIFTMRSSGPQLAVCGSLSVTEVMSVPIMAKSPLSSSQMSGQ